jgi:hypothetical protein
LSSKRMTIFRSISIPRLYNSIFFNPVPCHLTPRLRRHQWNDLREGQSRRFKTWLLVRWKTNALKQMNLPNCLQNLTFELITSASFFCKGGAHPNPRGYVNIHIEFTHPTHPTHLIYHIIIISPIPFIHPPVCSEGLALTVWKNGRERMFFWV